MCARRWMAILFACVLRKLFYPNSSLCYGGFRSALCGECKMQFSVYVLVMNEAVLYTIRLSMRWIQGESSGAVAEPISQNKSSFFLILGEWCCYYSWSVMWTMYCIYVRFMCACGKEETYSKWKYYIIMR